MKSKKINIVLNENDNMRILSHVVNNIWNSNPFTHVQVSDMLRLSKNVRLLDKDNDNVLMKDKEKQPNENERLINVRDILCSLKVLLGEEDASIMECLNLFSLFKNISKDNQKSLNAILSRMLIEDSLALKFFKLMANQSILAYPYILIKSKLEPMFQVIDKKGTWRIPVIVKGEQVIVSHRKKLRSTGEFEGMEIEWQLDIYYDRNIDYLEKCEIRIISIKPKRSKLFRMDDIVKAIEQKLSK